MPPLQEIASRAVFSTYPDWRAASGGFAGSFYAASDPGPDIVELAGNLKGGGDGARQDQGRFFFVAKDIRSVRSALGEGGDDVHPASTVLKNRYGDWKDKGALLVALLKAAGATAHPVLVNVRSVPPEEDVPTLKQFDALLVAVPRAGEGGFPLSRPLRRRFRIRVFPGGAVFPRPAREARRRGIRGCALPP